MPGVRAVWWWWEKVKKSQALTEWGTIRALEWSCRIWVLSYRPWGSTGVPGIVFIQPWSERLHLHLAVVTYTQNWMSRSPKGDGKDSGHTISYWFYCQEKIHTTIFYNIHKSFFKKFYFCLKDVWNSAKVCGVNFFFWGGGILCRYIFPFLLFSFCSYLSF